MGRAGKNVSHSITGGGERGEGGVAMNEAHLNSLRKRGGGGKEEKEGEGKKGKRGRVLYS